MVDYHQVITQHEIAGEQGFAQIKIFGDVVHVEDKSQYIIELSIETVRLLSDVIEKGQ